MPKFNLDVEEDARGADRYFTVFRPAAFWLQNFHGLLLICNISSGGLKGHVYNLLPVGKGILVDMHSGLSVAGRIAWADRVDVGIRFDREIDPQRVLEDMSAPIYKGLVQRAPRIAIQRPARMHTDRYVDQVVAIDLSQGGAKITADFARVGEELDLMISGFGVRRGRVVWTSFGCAGLQFFRAIDCISLAKWVNGLKHVPAAT